MTARRTKPTKTSNRRLPHDAPIDGAVRLFRDPVPALPPRRRELERQHHRPRRGERDRADDDPRVHLPQPDLAGEARAPAHHHREHAECRDRARRPTRCGRSVRSAPRDRRAQRRRRWSRRGTAGAGSTARPCARARGRRATQRTAPAVKVATLVMRVAVISDVHANFRALEAVLEEIDSERVDAVWCLGDTVGDGPLPNECCSAVESRADVSLVGNDDLVVLGKLPFSDFNDEAAAAARWTSEVLSPAARAFLEALEPAGTADGADLFHASARDPVWEYVLTEEAAAATLELSHAPLVLVGHSHVALAITTDAHGLRGGPRRRAPRSSSTDAGCSNPRVGRTAARRRSARRVAPPRHREEVCCLSPGRTTRFARRKRRCRRHSFRSRSPRGSHRGVRLEQDLRSLPGRAPSGGLRERRHRSGRPSVAHASSSPRRRARRGRRRRRGRFACGQGLSRADARREAAAADDRSHQREARAPAAAGATPVERESPRRGHLVPVALASGRVSRCDEVQRLDPAPFTVEPSVGLGDGFFGPRSLLLAEGDALAGQRRAGLPRAPCRSAT